MPMPLGCRLGWPRSVVRVRTGLATRLAVNAGLHVGAVIGSLGETDTALVADCDLIDTYEAAGTEIRKSKDYERAGGWTDYEASWQCRTVSSDCTADRIEFS